jgi:hypothetical protein
VLDRKEGPHSHDYSAQIKAFDAMYPELAQSRRIPSIQSAKTVAFEELQKCLDMLMSNNQDQVTSKHSYYKGFQKCFDLLI